MIGLSSRYVFKKKKWLMMAGCLDWFGFSFRQPPPSKKLNPGNILIVRLDQMGDIVQSLPVIDALKNSFPQARISFLSTTLGYDLLKNRNNVDDVFAWDCPWFDSAQKSHGSRSQVSAWIRKQKFDCVVELRGDIRLMALLRWAGVKNLVGYGCTGGGFLLDVHVPWDSKMPAMDKNLNLVKAIGGHVEDSIPRLANFAQGNGARESGGRFRLAIHPDAGTLAKRWPSDSFSELIKRLVGQGGIEITLVGRDKELGREIEGKTGCSLKNLMGKTSLEELINILRTSEGLLTNDSGPAHLMAALGKPVWILWSGTADSKIWAPHGNRVVLFEYPVDCAPCSLRNCVVQGHPCLSQITVENVYRKLVSAIPV